MDSTIVQAAIIAPIIVALILWGVKELNKIFEKHSSEHELLQEANLSQIKAQLLFMYRHAVDNGSRISTHEMEVFNDLYEVYIKLGGNGFIEVIKRRMNELEIVDD